MGAHCRGTSRGDCLLEQDEVAARTWGTAPPLSPEAEDTKHTFVSPGKDDSSLAFFKPSTVLGLCVMFGPGTFHHRPTAAIIKC